MSDSAAQRRRVRHAVLWIIGGAAVVAGLFLPADFLGQASSELMALFGLMMAAVLPTMVLAATVLRAGGLSVKRIASLRDALIRQVELWAGLFVIAMFSACLIVIGKASNWTIMITVPSAIEGAGWSINLARLLNAVLIGSSLLLLTRAKSVFDGIVSLINLSAAIAMSEARQRDEVSNRAAEDAVRSMKLSPDFGKYVDLPH